MLMIEFNYRQSGSLEAQASNSRAEWASVALFPLTFHFSPSHNGTSALDATDAKHTKTVKMTADAHPACLLVPICIGHKLRGI